MAHFRVLAQFAALTVVLLTFTDGPAEAARLKGKLRNDVYHSPAKNFVVPVPDIARAMGAVSDMYDDRSGQGAVFFYNPFGAYEAILYMPIPPPRLEAMRQPDSKEQALTTFFKDAAIPAWFLRTSPKSRVLHQAYTEFAGFPAVIALIEVPEGATRQNIMTGKRPDSHQAVVAFQRGSHLYLLSREATDLYDIAKNYQTWRADVPQEDWPRSIELLKPLLEALSFED